MLDADRVLLVQRGNEPMRGEWSLPGGKLEVGETLREGIVREVREETGLVITPGKIVEVLDRIVREESGAVRYHYVLVDFLCKVAGGKLQPSSDALDACWVSRNELSEYQIAAFTREVIERAFEA